MRRITTITLHWLTLILLVLLLAGGPVPGLAWAFAICGLLQCAIALLMGLMNGPGPKLKGELRIHGCRGECMRPLGWFLRQRFG